ncbi:hypothetical protein EV360DRAFT_76339 [Lentinula raphanica]|nr:hypothetical protein EV360DRAFT_76339 [Lentinula raphanica]
MSRGWSSRVEDLGLWCWLVSEGPTLEPVSEGPTLEPASPVRSGKEFQAYDLQSGHPISAPHFDLEAALDAYKDVDGSAEREYDIDLEETLSDLSDIESDGLAEPEDSDLPLPSILHSFVPQEDSSDEEEDPSLVKGKGKRARRYRKTLKNRKKRRLTREETQAQLLTGLKEIALRRASESQTLSPSASFQTEELPVNSGGWSGLRQEFERVYPLLQELLVDYEMKLVNWDGMESFPVADKSGR